MNIQTEFSIGDIAYQVYPKKITKRNNCVGCDGEGVIILKDGSAFECPRCDGVGYKEEAAGNKWDILYNPFLIRGIHITYTNREQSVLYQNQEGHYSKEENTFKSIESAQKECDLRNKSKP